MSEKLSNFVSAVVYVGKNDTGEEAAAFLDMLTGRLGSRFLHYELVFVNDRANNKTVGKIREYIQMMDTPPSVTMIHMSLSQGVELAMAAGLDACVGDFVYQFDTMEICYPAEYVDKAYDACIEGGDIVMVAPRRQRSLASRWFYALYNRFSKSAYRLRTDVFCLLSRRALNRVSGLSVGTPYRKAAYATSGLRLDTLVFDGEVRKSAGDRRLTQAVDSLALYTGLGYRFSFAVALVMLGCTLAVGIYTLVVFLFYPNKPIEGWTTTMLMLTGGFFGVFLVLTIVLKYLALILDLVFRKQKYLVENVEKIAKD